MNENRCCQRKTENPIHRCCSKSIQFTKWDAQASKWVQNVNPHWVLSNVIKMVKASTKMWKMKEAPPWSSTKASKRENGESTRWSSAATLKDLKIS